MGKASMLFNKSYSIIFSVYSVLIIWPDFNHNARFFSEWVMVSG